jgi:hypothetical protein
MQENVWKKNCPKCGREQSYCSKRVLGISILKNTQCNKCRGIKNRKHNGIFQRICKCGRILKYTCRQSLNLAKKHNSICRKCAATKSVKYRDNSFTKSNEYREKMSKSLQLARKCSTRYSSEECREKLRIAKLNQIRKLGTQHTYNPNACQFIDEYGRKNGYNFRHAMNGGEKIIAGYSLDGYDENKNVVFEYDEPKHNAPSVKKNDKLREQRIIKKIKPNMFIRYNEEFNKLYDVISRKELMPCLRQ